MCRWISYSGDPIPLSSLIVRPENSLVNQSMSAQLGVNPTNADGIGLGWYGRNNEPGLYHSVLPAWSDQNLKELSYHIESPLFLGHIRHSTGTAVQATNCHPFKYANWLFVHNGLIRGFQKIKREMVLAIDPKYFAHIKGSTDSELIFFLALTFGLRKDPLTAVEKTVGLIEHLAKQQGIEKTIQMTLGIADGTKLYAFRYSTEGDSRTLFYSESANAIKEIYPDKARALNVKARAVVSEPLSELSGVWIPVEESKMLIVENGEVEIHSFNPEAP